MCRIVFFSRSPPQMYHFTILCEVRGCGVGVSSVTCGCVADGRDSRDVVQAAAKGVEGEGGGETTLVHHN